MCWKLIVEKYSDLDKLIITAHIKNIPIESTLIDQGTVVNMMTIVTLDMLQFPNLRPTHIVFELVDRSKVKLVGILEDVIVSLDSWKIPVDFLVIAPKSNSGGHPMILRRPWLATNDALIRCRSREMTISNGNSITKITWYPLA